MMFFNIVRLRVGLTCLVAELAMASTAISCWSFSSDWANTIMS
jgi:hypothetical protein